jgi:methyl-accepting chemotaxis protein WspA
MKQSFRKRLSPAQYTSIVLLGLGVLIAVWMVKKSSAVNQRNNELELQHGRIRYDIAIATESLLRSLQFDPKNEAENKRRREAVKDLADTLTAMQTAFKNEPAIFAFTQKALATSPPDSTNFTMWAFTNFQYVVQDKMESDPTMARDYYEKNVPGMLQRRESLFSELTKQRALLAIDEDRRGLTFFIIGCVSLVVLGFVSLYLARLQTAAVSVPLNELVTALERMRGGDFTQRITSQRKDEFGLVGNGLNRLADDLSILVGQVQRSGIQVNMTATEIAATAKEQQSTTNEIAATTAEIGATSKEISATSKELDKTMNEVGQVAEDTAQLANSGQSAIGRMESMMRQIIDASSSVTNKLAVLNEKTTNINSVVTTITKVADQTNLLSLNAAIEAEKAGEYGLGFAVVAMEIRRLADQTAVATYDIEKMVKEMQSAVAAGVMGMDKFSEEVRRGVEEIRQVSTQLAQIIHQVQTLTPRFQTVSEGMHAQATGAQQISETLTQLSEAAHQSADSLRQSNMAIEQLNEAARGLQTSVARFKLEGK